MTVVLGDSSYGHSPLGFDGPVGANLEDSECEYEELSVSMTDLL